MKKLSILCTQVKQEHSINVLVERTVREKLRAVFSLGFK